MMICVFYGIENDVGRGENTGDQSFSGSFTVGGCTVKVTCISSFSQNVSNAFFSRVVTNSGFVWYVLTHYHTILHFDAPYRVENIVRK